MVVSVKIQIEMSLTYIPAQEKAIGKVSVLISADTSKDVHVVAAPGLRLRALVRGKVFELGKMRPKASRWRVTPVSTIPSTAAGATRSPHWRSHGIARLFLVHG